MSWFVLLRWIHILAATAWFGEVVTINLVLVPAVSRMTASERALTLGRIFPRIFRLASILSGTAAVTGLTMFAIKFWGNWLLLFGTWAAARSSPARRSARRSRCSTSSSSRVSAR